jgi:hypothetical protein
LLDWIGHHCDIAHWGLGFDDTGPFEVSGVGEFPPADAIWNTCTKYRVTAKYPNDIEMVIAGGHNDIRGGTKWIGTDGWVWVNRGNAFEASNPEWMEQRRLPEALRKVQLPISPGHIRNFLDCVKSRQQPVENLEEGHYISTIAHLGNIALRSGQRILWNPKDEKIENNSEADRLVGLDYRKPWMLPYSRRT